MTLSAHCESWLDGRRGNLAKKTYSGYESVFSQHVAGDPIGATALTDLSVADLTAWLERVGRKPGRSSENLSRQTLLHVYSYVSAALNSGVVWGLLDTNPLRLVETPKVTADSSKIKAWTPAEARKFMVAVKASDSPNERLWWATFGLILATGLRRGEAAGLMWRDVDLVARTLRVQRNRLAGEIGTSPTKTVRSSRTLDLSDDAIGFLAELETIRDADAAFVRSASTESDFVIAFPDGNPPRPDTFTQRFRRDCENIGVPYITLHGLRHTYATIALTNGEPAHIVSAALGHYDVAFTLSKYAAWIPRANVESMNRIGHHIFGTSTTENVTSGVT
jgi:integrase